MPKKLTQPQATMLFVIDNNAPATTAEVARHLLMDDKAARSRLATLERNGLVERNYTDTNLRGATFAYTLSSAGAEALEATDHLTEEEVEAGVCDLCGLSDGKHLRACILNPDRPRR